MNAISTYFHEALEEFHQVRWPTRHQAIRLSIITIGFVAVTSIAFGVADFVLGKAVQALLSLT